MNDCHDYLRSQKLDRYTNRVCTYKRTYIYIYTSETFRLYEYRYRQIKGYTWLIHFYIALFHHPNLVTLSSYRQKYHMSCIRGCSKLVEYLYCVFLAFYFRGWNLILHHVVWLRLIMMTTYIPIRTWPWMNHHEVKHFFCFQVCFSYYLLDSTHELWPWVIRI